VRIGIDPGGTKIEWLVLGGGLSALRRLYRNVPALLALPLTGFVVAAGGTGGQGE